MLQVLTNYHINKTGIFKLKRINPHTDTISNTIDNYTSPEKLLNNTMIELAPKYEEIENLLSHMPEPKKASDSRKYCESSYWIIQSCCFHEYSIKNLAKCTCLQ